MGYNNTATLKVITKPSIIRSVKFCEQCNNIYENLQMEFCPKDGQKLILKEVTSEVTDIIVRFREFSELADGLLKDNGKSSGEGYSNASFIVRDLKKFSQEYPNGLFQVEITWDQGFGETPSRYFVQNGKSQECKVQVIYDEFDSKKLK